MNPIINPTKEEMGRLRGIIYGIRNKINDKFYIGQTTRTFRERYRHGTWWKNVRNPYLKASIDKHGPDSFEVWIFAHSIENLDEINRLERIHAEKYNSYYPNGYNFRPCGDGRGGCEDPEYKERCGHHRKKWSIKNILSGEIFHVDNMPKFAKARHLSPNVLYRITANRGMMYKDFVSVETTMADVNNRRFYSTRVNMPFPPYTLWKDDISYTFDDIKEFIKNRPDLSDQKTTPVVDLLCGKIECYNGYSLTSGTVVTPTLKFYDIVVECPDGTVQKFDTLQDFVAKTGKSDCVLRRLINGKTKRGYSGYRVLSFKEGQFKRLSVI